MEWDFVEKLESIDLIAEFERLVNYTFCDSFKKCVIENNGGLPIKDVFDTDRTIGIPLHTMYSFNKGSKNNSIWDLYGWDDEGTGMADRYISFGESCLGDPICFDRTNDKVVFIDHETLNVEAIADDFDGFLNCLYEVDD